MFELVNKSLIIDHDEQEYKKMKEKIWILNKKELTEEIFFEQRFNVRRRIKIFIYN